MATTSAHEPSAVTAGDTVTWNRFLPDYPAGAGWVLTYHLVNADGRIPLVAVPDGDSHRIAAAAAATAAWSAGDYHWQAVVERSGERYTIGQGHITIRPDFASQVNYDNRSPARRALEALQSAYLDYLTNKQGHVAEYEIAGRRMKFRNAAEIWQQIDRLKREVAAEDRAARLAAGLPSRRRVLVRFGG